jgi:hypothetical protein
MKDQVYLPCAKYCTADDGGNPVYVRVYCPGEDEQPNSHKGTTQDRYE